VLPYKPTQQPLKMEQLIELELLKNDLIKERTYRLLNILHFSQDEYTPAVIPVIKDVLLSRNVPSQLIEDVENRYKEKALKIATVAKQQQRIAQVKKFTLGAICLTVLGVMCYMISFG
jgi:hypothetical protein